MSALPLLESLEGSGTTTVCAWVQYANPFVLPPPPCSILRFALIYHLETNVMRGVDIRRVESLL